LLSSIRATRPLIDSRPSISQAGPLPLAVDDDAALVEDLEHGKRITFSLLEARNVDPASKLVSEAHAEPHPIQRPVVESIDEQIDIRGLSIVTARHRADEHGGSQDRLGAQGLTQGREEPPVIAEVVELPLEQPQPAGAQTPRPDRAECYGAP
jgi:hypothetical protein